MTGLVFNLLEQHARRTQRADAWDRLIEEAGSDREWIDAGLVTFAAMQTFAPREPDRAGDTDRQTR